MRSWANSSSSVADAIGVVIANEVVAQAQPSYLGGLYARRRCSDEFSEVTVSIRNVPEDQDGAKFLDQFLGLTDAGAMPRTRSLTLRVLRKKARIMAHWATRIGALLQPGAGPHGNPEWDRSG